MSSKKRDRLPFEPQKKKPAKKTPAAVAAEESKTASSHSVHRLEKPVPASDPATGQDAKPSAIPDAVSKRMIRRLALFSGIPSTLGVLSFFLFYWIVSHKWLEIPPYAVLLVTMGLFGLGILGLSYGVLSASWDEERLGNWWGWQEFRLNFGRMTAAWRAERQEAQQAKEE